MDDQKGERPQLTNLPDSADEEQIVAAKFRGFV